MGELLMNMEKAQGSRGVVENFSGGRHQRPPEDDVRTLSQMGISKDRSSKAQKLAEIGE